MNLSKFCTCTDLKCPMHPTNHDKGCSLCISHNLKTGEIPNCFFKAVEGGNKHTGEYYYRDFADAVIRNKE